MFAKLSTKLKTAVEDASKPPELHPFFPPIGIDPSRAGSVPSKYKLQKPANTSSTTVYSVMNEHGQLVLLATGKYTAELSCCYELTGPSGIMLLPIHVKPLSGSIVGLDSIGHEIFRFKEHTSSLKTKYTCEFFDTSDARWHTLTVGGSVLGEMSDRFPIALDSRVLGQYEKVTTDKESITDAIMSSVIPVTEGLQNSSIEVLIAPGVDVVLMIAIAVALDHQVTEQKQALQMLGAV